MTNETNGEIDLIDIWLVISRRIRLFASVAVVVMVVGVVIAFFSAPHYDYSVTIKIGGIRNKSAFDLVETPESIIATIKNSILPAVLYQYASANPGSHVAKLKIDAINPMHSDVVVLEASGTSDQENKITSIFNSIVHDLETTEGSLLEAHVSASRKLLTSEISSNQLEIARLRKSRDMVTKSGSSESKAFTLLLIDNQISNLERNLFNLKEQLDVGLVADVRMTQAVNAPQRSLKATGITRSLIIMLSLLCGFVLGLFAVFVAEMLQLAKERAKAAT